MNNVTKAYNFFVEYPGHTKTATIEIAERLGVSYEDVAEGRKHFNSGVRPPSSLRTEIKSKEDFKEKAKTYDSIDDYEKFLKDNKIEEEDVVQVYYKQKADGVRFTVQTRYDKQEEINKKDLYEFLKEYNYSSSKPTETYKPKDAFAILNIFDAHIDKLGYTSKGGYWEAKENAQYLLGKAKILLDDILAHKPERIILPIGNDFFNTNAAMPETKKGTYQATSMHWQDSFKLGVWFYRVLIDMITEHCKVEVINIPGNHDKDKVFYLGEVIEALYETNDRVDLNMSKDKRKYAMRNGVLLGLAHGDVAKKKITNLPTAMAIEQPENWGLAKHRVWLLGDIHHKESYSSLETLEHNGVDIKFLRPATGADEWHTDQMWISSKKSVSYILYRDSGSRIIEDELFI